MKINSSYIFFLIGSFLIVGLSSSLQADREHYRVGDDHRKGKRQYQGKKYFQPPLNTTYQNICGGCHFPYPPNLLPAASWKKILDRSKNHFGEDIPCTAEELKEIGTYLRENGADRSSWKKSSKIMKSLKGDAPLRISEIPYIRSKHRKISGETFKRKSIGSFSNCRACHPTADRGCFNDDDVLIPK